jgi:DNA-binding HxlR family transcriptional regulator
MKQKLKSKKLQRRGGLRANDCDYGRAYFLLQERWVLFVLHHLRGGALSFNELNRRVPGSNPTTLSQRLSLLEEAGLVAREVHSTMPPKTSYDLTEAGHALEPILDSIAQWSALLSLRRVHHARRDTRDIAFVVSTKESHSAS